MAMATTTTTQATPVQGTLVGSRFTIDLEKYRRIQQIIAQSRNEMGKLIDGWSYDAALHSKPPVNSGEEQK